MALHDGITRRLSVFTLMLLIAGSSAWALGPPVVLAVPAGDDGLVRMRQWDTLVGVLRDEFGVNIELRMVEDYATVEKGLADRLYDLAFVDSLWYVILEDRMHCEPVVRAVSGGDSLYRSVLVSRKDSIVRSIDDLGGRSVALAPTSDSAAGFFVPRAMLDSAFSTDSVLVPTLIYSDTFESVLKAVSYGKVDAGFVSSSVLSDRRFLPLVQELRVVSTSDAIPQWTLLARPGLRPETVALVAGSLLAMGSTARGREALLLSGYDGFTQALPRDYERARGYYRMTEGQRAAAE